MDERTAHEQVAASLEQMRRLSNETDKVIGWHRQQLEAVGH
jgi:hypothetical protein